MVKITNTKEKPSGLKLNLLDKVISAINPAAGLKRLHAKATIQTLHGNPSGYISSRSGKRSMFDWNPTANTANEDSIYKLKDLRASCRDLAMNTPIATGALERVNTNAVGTGLVLQSAVDYKFLNMSKEEATKWERDTEREFNLWASSKECDISRTQNFYGLQQMALYNTLLSGDIFSIFVSKKTKYFPYSLKLRMVEADQCCNPQYKPNGTLKNGNTIIEGIEIDADDAPLYYNFRKSKHGSLDFGKWARVKAFNDLGLRNVLHLYEKKRPGQSRGIPLLSPVVEDLKSITRLSEYELMNSVVANFFTVFVKSKSPFASGVAPVFGDPNTVIPGSPPVTSPTEADKERKLELGAGAVYELEPDEEIDIADPKRPNDKFEPFFLAYVKQIGSALNIPFEELILHFSSSYSASRAALLQAWKFYRIRREWLCWEFCQPTYFRWLTEAVAIGRIDAPGFFDDPVIAAAWAGATWGGSGMGQIDPKRETEAAILKVDNYLSNREIEATALHGGSTGRWENIVERNISEKNLIDSETKTDEPQVNEDSKEPNEPTIEELEDNR